MTIDQLRTLFSTRELIDLQRSDQDFDHSLKLMLRDTRTGELGILEVTPDALILPDELMLDYKYESLPDREHCEDQIDAWLDDPLHGVTKC